MKTDFTIFFSWQSDVGKFANKSYIENKIGKTINAIKINNPSINIVLQESTSNETGSPEIKDAIIKNITNCDIFICDVTPIAVLDSEYGTRKSIPNPNVLFELGYAVSSLGWDRIIQVWNDQYGDAQYAPFDIRNHLRIHYQKNPEVKKTIRSLDLDKHISKIISDYDAILEKGIPSQEMRYDVQQFKHTQEIMRENELMESLRYFYSSSNYTNYMFNKWDDIYMDYTTCLNHHYVDPELDAAYMEFIANLKRTILIAATHFIPIQHTWEDIEPGLTKEQIDEIHRNQYFKLKDFYLVIRDSAKAGEEQSRVIREIEQSYAPLFDSYHKYRRLIQQTLYI